MPISHRHQAIFVHIPKTGGTSIEAALGMHGSRQDIGIVPYPNQEIDREHLYGRGLQHLTVEGLQAELGDEAMFRTYFKFSIVRNPWDRLVSTGAWSGRKWATGRPLERDEFDAFVRQVHAAFRAGFPSSAAEVPVRHVIPQSRFVLDAAGRTAVDFLGRFETLPQDWRTIRERLGCDVELPTRMGSRHRPYREYYDDETRELVAEMYASDIEAFGYRF